ncbi:MAG: GTP-binding protein [Patiriisocius sp.]|jgi:GTP-binding protein
MSKKALLIKTAEFIKSSPNFLLCPEPDKPEYAFIGRSNVGKSSLLNMLTNNSKLAKISSKPGKTQLINHFLINDDWYLTDLPGYGYAKISKSQRIRWEVFTIDYLLKRSNLMCVFVLIDSRIKAQKIDLEFMKEMGTNGVPFVMVFTKIDKLSSAEKGKFLKAYQKEILKEWESMPKHFITSTVSKYGREDLLHFIHETNKMFNLD